VKSFPALDDWSLPAQVTKPPTQVRDGLRSALAARARNEADPTLGRASAVLVPLFERDDTTHVWLLRRSDSLRRHQGQVAFPGGTRDEGDTSLLATALREAGEEVGLLESHADVLGPLDDLVTGTGFVITPHVAWVDPDFSPVPNPGEVARVFSVPLTAFAPRPTGEFPRIGWTCDGEFVWGATLVMLINLLNVMRET